MRTMFENKHGVAVFKKFFNVIRNVSLMSVERGFKILECRGGASAAKCI